MRSDWLLFACVIVNDRFVRALIYAVPAPISAAAFAVVGINKMMLVEPARSSATAVDVADAESVTVPVLFSLPSRMLLTT